MTTTAAYFDKRSSEWEELYKRDPRFARRFEVLTKFIAPLIKQHKVNRALDYGCGTGLYSRWLASQGLNVTGLDISPQMLERARDLCQGSIEFTNDLSSVAHAKFDAILALSVLEYVDDVESLLSAFSSATVTGGLLIASIPNPKGFVRRAEAAIFKIRNRSKGKLFGGRGDYLSHQRWLITPEAFDRMMLSEGYDKLDGLYYNAAVNASPGLLRLLEKKWWAALYVGAYIKR